MKIKYPRTFHLPWSLGATNDDKILKDVSCFDGKNVVITEKLDGENTTMARDYIHARSLDSRDHTSRSWVKQFHASFKHEIPKEYRICGENLYAKHSIGYEDLKSYFYCFSIWNEENICLSWKDTVEWCELLGIEHVPVLNVLNWNPHVHRLFDDNDFIGFDPMKMEGYVVRNSEAFHYSAFSQNVAKWVRKDHVQTDEHWMDGPITPNGLIKTDL